jgi:hypothetical protein
LLRFTTKKNSRLSQGITREQKCGAEFHLFEFQANLHFACVRPNLAIKFNKQFISRLEFIARVFRFVWILFLFRLPHFALNFTQQNTQWSWAEFI